jgi:hypothetical protein
MKKLKVSLLALSFVAGGIAVASAASSEVYRSYTVSAYSTNSTRVWDVYGIARPVSGYPSVQQNVDAYTDASGKIIGSGFIRLDFNTNNAPYSGYSVDISGKITTKGNLASVTMKAKGPGGLVNGDGTAEPGSIDLQFTGQPGPNPFNTNNPAVIVGKLKGNIKGVSPLSGSKKTYNFKDVLSGIPDSYAWNALDLETGVLQTEKKQQYYGYEYQGKGTIKNNTFKGTTKGIGWSKGSSATFNGTLGLYTNNIGTNLVPFAAPNTFEVTKGKTHGQTWKGVALRSLGEINASLVH